MGGGNDMDSIEQLDPETDDPCDYQIIYIYSANLMHKLEVSAPTPEKDKNMVSANEVISNTDIPCNISPFVETFEILDLEKFAAGEDGEDVIKEVSGTYKEGAVYVNLYQLGIEAPGVNNSFALFLGTDFKLYFNGEEVLMPDDLEDDLAKFDGKTKLVIGGFESGDTTGTFLIAEAFKIPAKETISIYFYPGEGTGEWFEIVTEPGNVKLPECKFTPPEGQQFKCWQIGGENYKAGEEIALEVSTRAFALYEAKTPAPKTGDSGEIVLWTAVMLAAALFAQKLRLFSGRANPVDRTKND